MGSIEKKKAGSDRNLPGILRRPTEECEAE